MRSGCSRISLRFIRATGRTTLPLRARLLGRALRGFGEPGGDRRGFGWASPARRVAAVAPGARPVEGVYAELVRLLHFIDPGRAHPIGVVVRRLVDFRQPELAVEHRFRNLARTLPHVGFANDVLVVVAGEGELAGQM